MLRRSQSTAGQQLHQQGQVVVKQPQEGASNAGPTRAPRRTFKAAKPQAPPQPVVNLSPEQLKLMKELYGWLPSSASMEEDVPTDEDQQMLDAADTLTLLQLSPRTSAEQP